MEMGGLMHTHKKYFIQLLILTLWICTCVNAQTVAAMEYFVDNDPGVGLATSISIIQGATVDTNFEIETTSLLKGFHTLFIRARNDTSWGILEARLFYIDSTATGTTVPIAVSEYCIDSDPGVGNATAVSGSGNIVDMQFDVPTGSLPKGFHTLFFRSQDSQGKWGLIETRPFYIDSSVTGTIAPIAASEYCIDSDPGVGNATAVSGSGEIVDLQFDVPTGSLLKGFHTLFFRSQDSQGKWGLIETRSFYIDSNVTGTIAPIAASEYCIDSDPGVGNATTVSGTGELVNLQFDVPTGSLLKGFHTLFFRSQDSQGKWGLIETRPFYIDSAVTGTINPITSSEYCIDSDPGVGNGTLVIGTGEAVDLQFDIPTGSLNKGFHTLFFRSKDSQGKWGLIETRPFYVDSAITSAIAQLTKLEYFFDTDPGVGGGTTLAIVPPADSINMDTTISFATLGTGKHKIVMRAQDAIGRWSIGAIDTFHVLGPLMQLDKKNVYFGQTYLESISDTVITITNTGDDTLEIHGIVSTNSIFTFTAPMTYTLASGQSVLDTIWFRPIALGEAVGKIIIITNDPKGPDTIVVSGYGIGKPQSSFSTQFVQFDTVKIGNYKDMSITISNTGNDTLRISALNSSRPTFVIRSFIQKIPPGSSSIDTVRFSPSQAGRDSALIIVVSNNQNGNDTLKAMGFGTSATDVKNNEDLPKTYSLCQNYPNPFNPSTTIRYALPYRSQVKITVFNMLGQEIMKLIDAQQEAGQFEKVWNAEVASGLYMYRLEAVSLSDPNKRFVDVKKMILLK